MSTANASKPLEVTIKRSRWSRGKKQADRQGLYNKDGTMCCLGFVARKFGAKVSEMKDCAWLSSVQKHYKPKFAEIGSDVCSIETAIANVNDDKNLRESTREKRLCEYFKDCGIKVRFVP